VRISRLYVPGTYEAGGTLTLEGDRSHYVKSVLRLKKGWKLTVFDGEGTECPATVEAFGRDATLLRLDVPEQKNVESPLKIHLALGVSRSERMDLALQKAVELGVTAITPLLTEFCVVRLDEERKANRHQHWEGVIRSACEQCGRNELPTLNPSSDLDQWLERQSSNPLRLFLDPGAPSSLQSLPPPGEGVTLMIGPEGGFSDREREDAVRSGFIPLRLGPRILRTETAVIATIAACQTVWGDLGA
jgi:16S rRNA (uracil1498-N3)-methyltransferase